MKDPSSRELVLTSMKAIVVYFFFIILILCNGCENNAPKTQIPFVAVDVSINLALQENMPLLVNGGYIYYNSAGYKGLIIYRESSNHYIALERACSYQPEKTCEKVKVDESGFFLIDACCGSTFDFEGNPTGRPAEFPLLQYNVFLDGNFLTIRNNF